MFFLVSNCMHMLLIVKKIIESRISKFFAAIAYGVERFDNITQNRQEQ